MTDFTGTGLSCIRGERVVFARVGFRLGAGALLELRGANGSGKSSLLRIMAGLQPPASGEIAWDRSSIRKNRDAHRARVNYVGHLDGIKATLTIAENLRFWMAVRGISAKDGFEQALDIFAIRPLADSPVRQLSAGQRRRAALARLVACPAPLWLLDEPTTSLDAASAAALDHAMAAHLGAGGIVVMATHEPGRPSTEQLDLDAHASGIGAAA